MLCDLKKAEGPEGGELRRPTRVQVSRHAHFRLDLQHFHGSVATRHLSETHQRRGAVRAILMGPTSQLREARPANRWEAGVLVDLVDSKRARDDARFVIHGIEAPTWVVPDLPKREKEVCDPVARTAGKPGLLRTALFRWPDLVSTSVSRMLKESG